VYANILIVEKFIMFQLHLFSKLPCGGRERNKRVI